MRTLLKGVRREQGEMCVNPAHLHADETGALGFTGLAQDAHQEANMDEITALKLIETLANGVHPVTGEILAPDSPCQNPDVLRALWLASRALDERRLRALRQSALPANVGKAWSEAENDALIAEFQSGREVSEIAALHQRTQAGIQARLEKLGLVKPATIAGPAARGRGASE